MKDLHRPTRKSLGHPDRVALGDRSPLNRRANLSDSSAPVPFVASVRVIPAAEEFAQNMHQKWNHLLARSTYERPPRISLFEMVSWVN